MSLFGETEDPNNERDEKLEKCSIPSAAALVRLSSGAERS